MPFDWNNDPRALLEMAGGQAAILGRQMRAGVYGRIIGAATGPLGRQVDYASNYVTPNMMPPVDALVDLWQSMRITTHNLADSMRDHGIPLPPLYPIDNVVYGSTSDLWSRWLGNSLPVPDTAVLLKWVRQQRIPPQWFDDALRRNGWGREQWTEYFREDYDNLPATTVVTLYRMGVIPYNDFLDRMKALGIRPADAQLILNSIISRPGVAESILMLNRGLIDEARARGFMAANGYTEPGVQDNLLALKYTLPSAGEIVSTFSRGSADATFAARWGLDDLQPAQMAGWLAKHGLSYPAYNDGQGVISWPQAAWRDHWLPMPVNLMIDATRRARGDPADPATWTIPGLPPLTVAEMQSILTANSIPTGVQKYVLGLAYAPLSIRHVRITYEGARKDTAWLVGKFLDIGIKPDDAADLATAYEKQRDDKDHKLQLHHAETTWVQLVKAIHAGYKAGAIDRNNAELSLANQGLDPATITRELNTIEIEQNTAVILAVQKRAKSDLFAGRTDAAGAYNRLVGAGTSPRLVTLLIQAWAAEFGEGRRYLSSEKVLRLLRKGFIDHDEAYRRLGNMGIARPDQILLLAEVDAEIAGDMAKAKAASELAAAREEKEIERLVGKLSGYYGKLTARLRFLTPISAVLDYYKSGIWDRARTAGRLALMGLDPQTIEAKIAEADIQASGAGVTTGARAERRAANMRRLYPLAKLEKEYKTGVRAWDWIEKKLRDGDYTTDAIAVLKDLWDKSTANPEGVPPLLPGEGV